MKPNPEQKNKQNPDYSSLIREDNQFSWSDDSRDINLPQSRYTHHIPPPEWAGELQFVEFGAHRRGPNSRVW